MKKRSITTSLPSCLLALLVPLLCVLGPARAEAQPGSLTLATGAPGGTYRSVYTPNLEALLGRWQVRTVKTTGSAENLSLLADGAADLGFVQADIFAWHVLESPERYGKLTVVGRLADECIFLAHRKDGPVQRLAQLGAPIGDRPPRVAVGNEGGGMAGTWLYMTRRIPALAGAETVHTSDTLAINQLDAGSLDAVGFVTDPTNPENKLIRAIEANDQLALLDVDDPALPNNLPDGTRIYEARTIKLGKGALPKKIKTVCTGALLVARENVDSALLERVSDLVSLDRERIVTRKR